MKKIAHKIPAPGFGNFFTVSATHNTMYSSHASRMTLKDLRDQDIVVHLSHPEVKCIIPGGQYYKGLLNLSVNFLFPGHKKELIEEICAKYEKGIWRWTYGEFTELAQQIDEF